VRPFALAVDEPAVVDYLERTPRSAELFERAAQSMPGGSTRSHGFYFPYPLVFERGQGAYLWDVDGTRYVDYTYNGLSLIHGYGYHPVERAVAQTLPGGAAWVGTSRYQIAYAEYLRARVPGGERIRFTNSGTEATMLAAKLAREYTGRPLILKSYGGYHGSYDDLEAGLYGIGELRGRTALATFGDLESYRRAFDEHPGQIAAIMIEPVQLSFNVIAPPDGFLGQLADLARSRGALVVVDDCLMFRLAVGGSAEMFDFEADLTCLGKFIGGGLPMGVVAGRTDVMRILDPFGETGMYHGGTFNGNPLASVAGLLSLKALTREKIRRMNDLGGHLRDQIAQAGVEHDVPLKVSGCGSVLGVYVVDDAGRVDRPATSYLHLAACNRGVFYGPDGDMALSTAVDDHAVESTMHAMHDALEETAHWARLSTQQESLT
jgi:glutamate-1-semialdehyde 2,1-aminomutase